MFQQLLAMQSMQALQGMLTGTPTAKAGERSNRSSLYHNAASFTIVICIDMFRRLMDVSVTSMIDNRVRIVQFLCRLLRDGWRRVLACLIAGLKLIQPWTVYSLWRRLLRRDDNRHDATETLTLPRSLTSTAPNSVVQGLSTLHEWQMILRVVPPEDIVSFHRYPHYTWQRQDATSTRFVETLSDIVLTCDENTTARIPGTFELEWDVLQHRSLFDSSKVRHERRLVSVKTAHVDPRLEGVFDTSRMVNLTSLLSFVPFPRFTAYIDALKRNPDTFALSSYSACFKKTMANNGGQKMTYLNLSTICSADHSISCVLNSVANTAFTYETYDGPRGRLLCGADLTYLLVAMFMFVDDKVAVDEKHDAFMTQASRFLGQRMHKQYVMWRFKQDTYIALSRDILGADPPEAYEVYEVGEWMLRQLYPDLHADHVAAHPKAVQKRDTSATKMTDKNQQVATYTVELLSLTTPHASSLELLRAWDAFLTRIESNHDEHHQGGGDKTNAADGEQQQFVPKTFALHVREHETETSEPNPEYEAYENKMRLLEPSSANRDENNGDLTAIKLALFEARPEKVIRRVTRRKVVHQELVNETRRDLSALYLRERDERTLNTCLVNFRDNKAALAELGIPNKLGVLLHGLPGTGKSSTIAAIATFLKKDVFYLHLNEIRCNAALKMAFDHVFKVHPGGGVIVMEDVDAMSNVVRRRRSNENDVDGMSDTSSSLTLEFFLNVLQGSLTVDGSVFVATTNHLLELDPAFCRKGRFDVSLEMRASDRYQITRIFRRFFHRTPSEDVCVRLVEDAFTPAEVIAHFAQYLLRAEHTEDAHILEPFLET